MHRKFIGDGLCGELAGSVILSGIMRRFNSRRARLLGLVAGAALAFALPAFAASAGASAPAATTSEIAGYWHIDGRLAGNAIRLVCHFDQSKPDFTGLCFGDGTRATGNFAKGRAVWRWKVAGHLLTFDGMLGEGSMLKGRISTVAFAGIPVVGHFHAVRPEAEEAREPPQGKAALKVILGDLARGELPTENCTTDFADGLRKQMPALQQAYEKLGAVTSVSYVDTLHGNQKVSTEIYDVNFSGAKRVCSIDITNAGGKLSDLICASE